MTPYELSLVREYTNRCVILKVKEFSDKETVRKSFIEQIKLNHPDVNKSSDAEDISKKILNAYNGFFELEENVSNIKNKYKENKTYTPPPKNPPKTFSGGYDDMLREAEKEAKIRENKYYRKAPGKTIFPMFDEYIDNTPKNNFEEKLDGSTFIPNDNLKFDIDEETKDPIIREYLKMLKRKL